MGEKGQQGEDKGDAGCQEKARAYGKADYQRPVAQDFQKDRPETLHAVTPAVPVMVIIPGAVVTARGRRIMVVKIPVAVFAIQNVFKKVHMPPFFIVS
jgi:hypothetical protein